MKRLPTGLIAPLIAVLAFLSQTATIVGGPGDPGLQTAQAHSPAEIRLTVDPNASQVRWTLGATAHTVHGSFKLSRGTLQVDRATGKASGEIVVAATSGDSGNDGRDQKMHKEVLESTRYPDIVFRPDRVEGSLASAGASNVQLHGTFDLHGSSHEMTVPVEAKFDGSAWTATSKFNVPYVQWGLKNPSTFFLRVKQETEVELILHGTVQAAP
jgi:polyisoprenoid-binding protein YceI